jgi:D-glycero-beta-D-manno-heptose-7-phosphate kinase
MFAYSDHATREVIMSNLIENLKIDSLVRKSLIEKVTLFANKKILVIGDVGVDEYVFGAVKRISPEAPVPVLEVEGEDKRLGLAANVAQNVISLGGEVQLVSVIGSDEGAVIIEQLLSKAGVKTDFLVKDISRPTTRKTRIMTGQHHLVRVDHEIRNRLNIETEKKLISVVESCILNTDVVVLEDYAKGLLSKEIVEQIVTICKRENKFLMVDPHQTKFADFYKGVDLIKPNYNEALALTQVNEESLENAAERVIFVGQKLQAMTGAKQVVLTQGKDGMTLFSQKGIQQVPTFAKKVFDVTGAGDTVIAALALGVAAKLSLAEACTIANFAAGVVVGKVGCVPCEQQELVNYINNLGV